MVRDHLGHTFLGVREMYLFWGLTEWVYYERKGKGWPLEKILTTPLRVMGNNNTDDTFHYTQKLERKRKTDRPYERREYRLTATNEYRLEHGTVTVREYQRG